MRPQLEGQLLTLVAESGFVKKVVDIPEVLEPAARIASGLLGGSIRVRCVQRGKQTAAGADDPMRALLSFGQEHSDIITIKE